MSQEWPFFWIIYIFHLSFLQISNAGISWLGYKFQVCFCGHILYHGLQRQSLQHGLYLCPPISIKGSLNLLEMNRFRHILFLYLFSALLEEVLEISIFSWYVLRNISSMNDLLRTKLMQEFSLLREYIKPMKERKWNKIKLYQLRF